MLVLYYKNTRKCKRAKLYVKAYIVLPDGIEPFGSSGCKIINTYEATEEIPFVRNQWKCY
jgi:hypothetical protein